MTDDAKITWHRAGTAGEVDDEEPLQVKVGDLLIAVCKVGADFYAINDICSHEYACLSDGFVEGDHIECPLHQARFHIPTGKALSAPATEDIATYPLRLEGEDIWVGLPGD
jgi:nitrite reductase/ring-hydroxylating ferredoxin subunit